jgi:hypothetical protein
MYRKGLLPLNCDLGAFMPSPVGPAGHVAGNQSPLKLRLIRAVSAAKSFPPRPQA